MRFTSKYLPWSERVNISSWSHDMVKTHKETNRTYCRYFRSPSFILYPPSRAKRLYTLCLFICLSIYACLSICLSVYMSVSLSTYLSASLSVHLSVPEISMHLPSICPPLYPYINPSVNPSANVSVCLLINLSEKTNFALKLHFCVSIRNYCLLSFIIFLYLMPFINILPCLAGDKCIYKKGNIYPKVGIHCSGKVSVRDYHPYNV